MLGHADAVWVSTAPLAAGIQAHARDVTVVPNGLDERIWTAAPPNRPSLAGPARLFCMGTTTHERDFALIAPALIRLKEEFGTDVEIDIIGMTALALPPGLNRCRMPHQAAQSYPAFVNWLTAVLPGWHMGLSPLLDTPFNRGKSPIKAMDYAALGLTVLASDMPVYRGSLADGPAGQLVANDHLAWYAALSWLIRDRGLMISRAAAAREAFLATSSLAVQAEARRAAWQAVLRKRRIDTAA
jgi:glycosyltransferase involved in cell wall biosynthesis